GDKGDRAVGFEAAWGGRRGTAGAGGGAQIVFARFRLRVTGGLIPGETYTVTSPFGNRNFVAAGTGTITFTDNQGCGAVPPACDFSLALVNTNIGPFLQWDALAPAGFIGNPLVAHTITGSPFASNVFRLHGAN